MNPTKIFKDFRSKGYVRALLEWLIGFTVILIILMLISGNSIMTSLTVGSIAGSISAVVIITSGFWYEEFYLRKLMSVRLDSPTFKPLVEAGFLKKGTVLQGIYNGYYGCAYWTEGNPFGPDNKVSYAIRLVFEFDGKTHLTSQFVDDLAKNEQIIWGENHIEGVLTSGRTKLPSQRDLVNMADNLTDKLRRHGLLPKINK